MIEVLVALIILLVGLLGLAGLMVQSQRSELESYQRVQALALLQDMAARLNANHGSASCYAFTNAATGAPFAGTSASLTLPIACAVGTASQQAQAIADVSAWNSLLLGSGEISGGTAAGAMIGARGCVSYNLASELPQLNPITGLPTGNILAGTGIYTITVVWQGLSDTFAPVAGLNCGIGQFTSDAQRRAVSLSLRIPSLS